MKYALKLAEDKRILSACVVLPNGNYDGMPLVDALPEDVEKEANLPAEKRTPKGNLPNYMWIDDAYVYDPRPEPEQPEPAPSGDSVWDELDAAYTAGYEEGYTEGVNSAYDQ